MHHVRGSLLVRSVKINYDIYKAEEYFEALDKRMTRVLGPTHPTRLQTSRELSQLREKIARHMPDRMPLHPRQPPQSK